MYVYPLSERESRVVCWATRLVAAAAVALLVFWFGVSLCLSTK